MSFAGVAVATGKHQFKFPEDKWKIARLSLAQKQEWYAAQDPQALLDLVAHTKLSKRSFDTFESWKEFERDFSKASAFRRFWFWMYIMPLRLKRTLFWFKFW